MERTNRHGGENHVHHTATTTGLSAVTADRLPATAPDLDPAGPPPFPPPAVRSDSRPFLWDADLPPAELYPRFATRLRAADDLYRLPGYGAGLLLACPGGRPATVALTTGGQLAPVIVDRVNVLVFKDGKPKGGRVPAADLTCMVKSELFLSAFRPLDQVTRQPLYLGDRFQLTAPGYNDGGPGNRILYLGPPPAVRDGTDAINRFLDVMAFAGPADRTNAVALALTVLLRNHWPGGKPIGLITSTKSHGGKDTVVEFAAGRTPKASISHEQADWAVQKAFVAAVKAEPELGVVNVENVRLEGGGLIASAFLERLLTDPEPLLHSPGTGGPTRRSNHFVLTLTSNVGSVCDDLLNRGLPIHLTPTGDVAARTSPIGNPKLEYLPANRDRIEAELRGMVARWTAVGMPLDTAVRHPFDAWARVVGGILQVSGFTDFLGNYGARKTSVEPDRRALGLLGAAAPEEWLSVAEWVPLVAQLGLTRALIPQADRASAESRRRGLGVTLSAHAAESFVVETDAEVLTLRVEKARRRFDGGAPQTRYRFSVLDRRAVPTDD